MTRRPPSAYRWRTSKTAKGKMPAAKMSFRAGSQAFTKRFSVRLG